MIDNSNQIYTALDYDPFDGDFGNSDDIIFSDKMVKGRKSHQCGHCSNIIQVGEIHRSMATKFDGMIHNYRWCGDCCNSMIDELTLSNDTELQNSFPFESRLDLFKT